MAKTSGSYTTAFTLNSAYNSLATYTAKMNLTIPTGATVNSATISVTVSQDPSKGSYFYVGSTTWQSGLKFGSGIGTKTGDYTNYVSAGITSLRIPFNFKSLSDTTVSSQLTISTITLSVTYTEGKTTVTSVTSANVGGGSTISLTVQNSAYKHVITATLGGASQTVANLTTYTKGTRTVSFTVSTDLAYGIPSAASGTGTVTVVTYAADGTTRIGSSSASFAVTVPSTYGPTASLTATKSNGCVTEQSGYIQGLDGVDLTGTGTGQLGASIVRVAITGTADNPAYSVAAGSATKTVKPLNTSGAHTYTCTVTDSRGYTGSATVDLTVTAYTKLTLSGSAYRTNGSAVDPAGTYLGASVTVNHTATVTIAYTATSVTNWVTAYSGSISSTYASNNVGSVGSVLTASSNFTVRITATDGKLSLTNTYAIGTAYVYLYMDAENKKLGIGATPTSDNQMMVSSDFTMMQGTSYVARYVYINCGTISSSSATTITNSQIRSTMYVAQAIFGTPSAQLGNWTIDTSDGSLTVTPTGGISGSTTLALLLVG